MEESTVRREQVQLARELLAGNAGAFDAFVELFRNKILRHAAPGFQELRSTSRTRTRHLLALHDCPQCLLYETAQEHFCACRGAERAIRAAGSSIPRTLLDALRAELKTAYLNVRAGIHSR